LDLRRHFTDWQKDADERGGIPTCYASCSIGHKPEHNLPAKLKAISQAGFDAIELSMPDLPSFANKKLEKEAGPKDYDDSCQFGLGLKVLILQPFANFEEWKKGLVEAKMQLRERKDGCGL
jgi:sugar phosphate isomerase/epimerase